MNYLGCVNCHQRDFVLISNKTMEDEDGEEIVTYDRKLTFILLSRHGPFQPRYSAAMHAWFAPLGTAHYS
jgi:hypothetical protein